MYIRAPDKLLFGVKHSIILSKNQLSFKRWGTITKLIDRVPYLLLTSGVNLKTFSENMSLINFGDKRWLIRGTVKKFMDNLKNLQTI